MQSGGTVDNNTYNIIMALAKNLEACEVYQKYAKDGNRQLWEQLSQQAMQTANTLQQELIKVMGQSGQSQTFQSGYSADTTGINNSGTRYGQASDALDSANNTQQTNF